MTPRIAPIDPTTAPEDLAPFLTMNIFTTLANNPGLTRKWLPFGGKLLMGGSLDARTRELAILRTAWNVRCDYEWGQHVSIAREAGLDDDEIARVAEGPDAPAWSAEDALLLRACDELSADRDLGDATWAGLAARFDTRQLVELPMLVGHYAMVAGALKALRVERDPGVDGFPT
jgi:4-carboxymuconolactone decarboxylase